LTEAQKAARVQKCRQLLARDDITFFDNQQNDRFSFVSLRVISREELVVKRFQNMARVMVWNAISKKRRVAPSFHINSFFFTKRLVYIVTESQQIGLFGLGKTLWPNTAAHNT
jgi:hypothetical protein